MERRRLPPRGMAVRELDLNQAADEVMLAIADGFTDVSKLKSAPESKFLLEHEDVNSAVRKLKSVEIRSVRSR